MATPTTDSALPRAHTLDSDSDSDTMRTFFCTDGSCSPEGDQSVLGGAQTVGDRDMVPAVADGILLSHVWYELAPLLIIIH